MDVLKVILFFVLPAVSLGITVAVLDRLNEKLDEASSKGSRISSAERAGVEADSTSQKLKRNRALKEDSPRLPREVSDYSQPELFEPPADFNLADFSERQEPQHA